MVTRGYIDLYGEYLLPELIPLVFHCPSAPFLSKQCRCSRGCCVSRSADSDEEGRHLREGLDFS